MIIFDHKNRISDIHEYTNIDTIDNNDTIVLPIIPKQNKILKKIYRLGKPVQ